MDAIHVLAKIILDAMLSKMDLPKKYTMLIIVVKTMFCMPVLILLLFLLIWNSKCKNSLSASAFRKLEAAENNLATKAIEYTEQHHHRTSEDYNYAKLNIMEKVNKNLLQTKDHGKGQQESTPAVINKGQYNHELSKGWDSILKTVSQVATDLHHLDPGCFTRMVIT
jgi:hypothetical protein